MDRMTQPQQLSFSFDFPPQASCSDASTFAPTSPSLLDFPLATITKTAEVYNFKSAVAKREASARTFLYRKILESVRHIG